jgi:DNA helicase IV
VPTAAAAVAELTTVEAQDLAVVSGGPRVTVRFTGEDDAQAIAIGRHAVDRTKARAEVVSWRVTRRVGGRWYPVSP